MNKKGSLGLTIVATIFFMIIGFASINFVMDEVTNTTTQLNCDSATTLTGGSMLLCLMLDSTVIYFMITLLSLLLGFLTAELLI